MLAEELNTKWKPVLEHSDLPEITDSHKRLVTATVLENTERALREAAGQGSSQQMLGEGDGHVNSVGSQQVANFDPVLISLVRRSMPNLIAYDVCGVQPMNGPTGLIFAMRSQYANSKIQLLAKLSTTKLTLVTLRVSVLVLTLLTQVLVQQLQLVLIQLVQLLTRQTTLATRSTTTQWVFSLVLQNFLARIAHTSSRKWASQSRR